MSASRRRRQGRVPRVPSVPPYPPPPTKGSMVATDHSRTPNARQYAGNFNETLSPSALLSLDFRGERFPPSSSRFRNTVPTYFCFWGEALDELTRSKREREREKWRASTKRFIVLFVRKEIVGGEETVGGLLQLAQVGSFWLLFCTMIFENFSTNSLEERFSR